MTRQTHELYEASITRGLEWTPEDIKLATQHILSGELDNNLPVIFNSQAQYYTDFAMVSYIYNNLPVEEFITLIGRSALASANTFRLTEGDLNDEVDFTWSKQTRKVPKVELTDSHNSNHIISGLRSACIANRASDLELLASLPIQKYDPQSITSSDYYLYETQFTQYLCLDDYKKAINLRDRKLNKLLQKTNELDGEAYKVSGRDLLLSLPDVSEEKFHNLLEAYLKNHKKTFDTKRNNGRGIILGLFSLTAIFYSVLAYKRGIKVSIDNPYFPIDIYEHVISQTTPITTKKRSIFLGIKKLLTN